MRYLVPRPRLLDGLDGQSGITVVRAPIGFGKTTLLAQWQAAARPDADLVVWQHVRAGGVDNAGFWRQLVRLLAHAGIPGPEPMPAAAAELAEEAHWMISQAGLPVLLVIDGFDRFTDDQTDHAVLEMMRHSPGLRIIAAGRSHRHFPREATAGLDETLLSAHDLLFTAAETAQLFTEVGVQLPAACVESLHAAVGGWPQPTRSVALALRDGYPGRGDADPGEAEVVAVVRGIAIDYLHRTLLPATNRPDRIAFALATSVPEQQFSAELAEQLTENAQAKAHLEWLHGEGVLLSELREGQATYRWPAAARDALLAELRRRDPDREAQLHARLARWYLSNDQPEEALRQAVASCDWPLVVQVIEKSWRQLLYAHPDALFDAFTATPLEAVATSPRALALRDYRHHVPDDLLLAVASLPGSPDELAELGSSEHGPGVIETGLLVGGALRRRGLFYEALTYFNRLHEVIATARGVHTREVAADYPGVQRNLGVTRLLTGDLPGALQPLQASHEFAADSPRRPYYEADAASKLAVAHALLGETDQTQEWLARCQEASPPHTWLDPMIGITAVAAELLLAVDGLDLHAAAAANQQLGPQPPRIEEFWAYALYAQAQYALHTGAATDMLGRLDRARATFARWLGPGALAGPLLAATDANLHLAAGRASQAHTILRGPHAGHPVLQVTAARLALITGSAAGALRLATDRSWDRVASARARLEMLLIQAVAAHRTHNSSMAGQALRHAVEAARRSRVLAPFTTVPRDALAELAGQVPEAGEILGVAALSAAPDTYPTSATLIRLTNREHRVLDELAKGQTMQQIANNLTVSVNTVKSQLTSLYRKLGADNRDHALDYARQTGLLPSDPAPPTPPTNAHLARDISTA